MGLRKSRSEPIKRGKRKGSLEETISFALHKDDSETYRVYYRDKDSIKVAALKEFILSEYFSQIPLTRIVQIKRSENEVIWNKGQKEVTVKGRRSV
jgi:uncharacterized protein (UPF0248 family)